MTGSREPSAGAAAAAGTTIRLFVSSTFADFQRERELLQRRVFPEIRRLCLAEGFRFLPIDLRWGVSEQAGTAQRTLPIIFEELRRCQQDSPEFNFLLLMGDRYGSHLLPTAIPQDDYSRLEAAMDDTEGALLAAWYTLDTNAQPPEYVLRSPQEQPMQQVRQEREQKREAVEAEAAEAAWHREVAEPLLAALAAAAKRADRASHVALPYTASVTHLEVQRGLLDVGDPSGALCVVRRFTQPPTGPAAANYVETDPTRRQDLADLKAAVEGCLATYRTAHPEDGGDLALSYTARWDEQAPIVDEEAWVRQLQAALERRARAAIARRRAAAPARSPTAAANARFVAERVEHFVGREEPLEAIAAYLDGPAEVPLVVAGPGGVGKSTLVAKAVEQATAAHSGALLLVRYIGVTPGTGSLPTLLDDLRTELAAASGQEAAPVREEYERAEAFRQALGWATAARPLILVLDALDQLGPPPVPLDWLPDTLPPYVHLAVSLLDEDDRPELKLLMARQPTPLLVPLGRMEEAEGADLLEDWLDEAGRALTPPQRAAVLTAFEREGRPLYLRLAFEEARRWRSFDEASDLPPLAPTIPGILHGRFGRLERPDEHGPVLTSHTLGLLRAAKNGLAEDELLDMLARDDDVRQEQRALAPFSPPIDSALPLPTALWARFYADLAPYLAEREADGARLFTFYHRQLAQVAEERYLRPPDGAARHQALARYFEAQSLMEGTQPNLRKLSELPAQEAAGGLTSELQHTLTNLSFLEQKIAYQGTAGTLDDLALAPAANVTLVQVAGGLRLGASILDDSPEQTENQVRGRLPSETIAHLHDVPVRSHPWLRLDSPTLIPVGGPLLGTLTRHTNQVTVCTFSPDGRLVLSGSEDNTLRLWEVATGRLVHLLTGHTSHVWACAFSLDGRLILSSSSDSTLRSWDAATGHMVHVLERHLGGARAWALSPDGRLVVSGSDYETLRLREVNSGQTVHVLIGHTGTVMSCAFSPDGRLALSASEDRTLRLWDVASGQTLRVLEGHHGAVDTCAFSPDGRLVLSGGFDYEHRNYTLRLWDVASGRTLRVLEGDIRGTGACEFSHDGRLILSIAGGTVRLWEVANGRLLHELSGHEPHTEAKEDFRVVACAFSPDSRLILSASRDLTLVVSEVASGRKLRVLTGHTAPVTACAFSPDGRMAVSGAEDGILRLWNVESRRADHMSHGHSSQVNTCAFTPDGRLALSASADNTLRLWDVASGQTVHVLEGHTNRVIACAFSPDGRLAISGSRDETLRLWEVTSGRTVHVLEGHGSGVEDCAFSPDGRLAASATWGGDDSDGSLRLWDVASGRAVQVLRASGVGDACAFSPDGRLVLSPSGETLHLWDVSSGQAVHVLEGHTNRVIACAFSPDGRLILSASIDDTLRLWDVGSGQTLHVLEGHTWSANVCVFSPDGRLALSASEDRTLRLWEVASGRMLHVLEGHGSVVTACAFSPDGRLALSASVDHTLRLWDVKRGLEMACFIADVSLLCCAFSPHGWRLVAGDDGGAVHFLSIVGTEPKDHALLEAGAIALLPSTPSAPPAKPAGRRFWWPFGRRDSRD